MQITGALPAVICLSSTSVTAQRKHKTNPTREKGGERGTPADDLTIRREKSRLIQINEELGIVQDLIKPDRSQVHRGQTQPETCTLRSHEAISLRQVAFALTAWKISIWPQTQALERYKIGETAKCQNLIEPGMEQRRVYVLQHNQQKSFLPHVQWAADPASLSQVK